MFQAYYLLKFFYIDVHLFPKIKLYFETFALLECYSASIGSYLGLGEGGGTYQYYLQGQAV